jgi:hypothetical protein
MGRRIKLGTGHYGLKAEGVKTGLDHQAYGEE